MTPMLKPGFYSLVPAEIVEYHDGTAGDPHVAVDPHACYNLEDESSFMRFDAPTAPIEPLAGVDGGFVLTVDLKGLDPEGSSVVGPFGPLTIARHYALVPATGLTANAEPAEQYAINWLSFELTGEQPLVVEDSVIRIGAMEIDPTILGDVELGVTLLDGVETSWSDIRAAGRTDEATHVVHVARHGDPLNAILSRRYRAHDDGVLVCPLFAADDIVEVEWIGTDAAMAFAREMRRVSADGGSHLVLHPHFA